MFYMESSCNKLRDSDFLHSAAVAQTDLATFLDHQCGSC